MIFEYDDVKNQKNIKKHGIDFRSAARNFFDYDRIEMVDDTMVNTDHFTAKQLEELALSNEKLNSLAGAKNADNV